MAKNVSLLFSIYLFVIVFIYFIKTVNSSLGLKSFENCVVHLKTFSNDEKSMDEAEEFIHFNRAENPIWTFYDLNDTRKIAPTHEVYERCEISVVVDLYNNPMRLGEFIYFNDFSYLSKSIFIIVTDFAPTGFHSILNILPTRVFWVIKYTKTFLLSIL